MKRHPGRSPGRRVPLTAIAAVVVMLAACFTHSAPAKASDPDPCSLLTDETILEVQGASVSEHIASTQKAPGFRVLQCLFKTGDFSSSVSVALTLDDGGGGALRYWQERFDVDAPSGGDKEDPPKSVPDLGDAAYWVGDPFTGSLYVLAGDRFLRISIGGVADEDHRLSRSRTLAAAAMSEILGSE